MQVSATAENWTVRLALLAMAGSASASLLLGAGVVQSDPPSQSACIVAGGLELLSTAMILAGTALFACWGLAASKHSDWSWRPKWRIHRLPRPHLKMKDLRSVLALLAVIGTASSLITIASTMTAGTSVARQVANGACDKPG